VRPAASDVEIRNAFFLLAKPRFAEVAAGAADCSEIAAAKLESLCFCLLFLSDRFMRAQYDAGWHTLDRPARAAGQELAGWAATVWQAVEKWRDDGDELRLNTSIRACVQAAVSGNHEKVEITAIQLALDHAESIERLYRKDDTALQIRSMITLELRCLLGCRSIYLATY
jgi:hypothetical protein